MELSLDEIYEDPQQALQLSEGERRALKFKHSIVGTALDVDVDPNQRRSPAPESPKGIQLAASTVPTSGAMDTPAGTEAQPPEPVCLTVKQCAAKTGLSYHTLYHWIESGKLDEAHGLRRFGSRRLIDWQVFKACLERGDFK